MSRVAPVAAPDWDIAIARHGATEWTGTGRFTGHADIGLSRDGRDQAEELANALRRPVPEAIVTSDLARARCTARIIARAAGIPLGDVGVSEDLREEDLGSWQGLTRAQVAALYPAGLARWESGGIGPFDGREGLVAVARRALPVLLHRIADPPRATGRLVVVTHTNTALALTGALTGVPPSRWAQMPDLAPASHLLLRRRGAGDHWSPMPVPEPGP